MEESDKKYPSIQKSLQSFIEDEEGNIPAKKLITIGSLIILLGAILSMDVFAKHGSHSSHKSHSSHSSSSYHRSHASHSNSHSSHISSHGSHASHTSHSNTASHSNANYSSAGDLGISAAPSASSIKAPPTPITIDTTIGTPVPSLFSQEKIVLPELQTPQDTVQAIPKDPIEPKVVSPTPEAVDPKAKQSIIHRRGK